MLNLMYITNRPSVALIAEDSGVDRIFVDMEYIGKGERQAGLDTVKSRHTISDVKIIRNTIKKTELLVRINPIHDKTLGFESSEEEIDRTIDAGAEILMLPMFRTMDEVERFLIAVGERCKSMLLVETPEAVDVLEQLIQIDEIDEIHVGLNDLHLALHRKFMFELLADGTVDDICQILKKSGKKYGFGGIARLGYGDIPAEYIITEHYRLGSQMAILSRSFCNANIVRNPEEVRDVFVEGVKGIRDLEQKVSIYTNTQFEYNRLEFVSRVNKFVKQSED